MDRNWRSHHSRGQCTASRKQGSLPSPGSDIRFEDVFDFPCIRDDETIDYLSRHGRVMFFVRGQAGTGKHTLSSMIVEKYPHMKKCSADDYFSQPFTPSEKNSITLKKSHAYCHEEAQAACKKNRHPIIIQNSMIRKWEMQFYIDLAIQYGYTIIMVITTRKVSCAPEVLEKTNTQGLKKDYFRHRLKQWEEVIPEYTGWVPCPADIACIMTEAHTCMESLREVQDFSGLFGTTGTGGFKDFFKPEFFPFCLAAYCNKGANPLAKDYYLSENVQQVYGKVFDLFIQAFVVTRALMAAVVHLDGDMEKLILENKGFDPQHPGDLSHILGAFNLNSDFKVKQPVTDFSQDSQKTMKFCTRMHKANINTKNISFIILSTAVNEPPSYPYIRNASELSSELFSDVSDSDGHVSADSFNVSCRGVKYSRLPRGSWLILPPEEIHLKSVFTGLYV